MTAILALLFKIVGVGFLFVAAIGVIRFSDAFQRMHAATKAGTLGAGLVILGAILSHGATSATIIGLLTIVFLLMTVPVAGHMLGRASYISGADMTGLRGENALDGILERQSSSLEDRLGQIRPIGGPGKPVGEPIRQPVAKTVSEPVGATWLRDLSEIKVAIIHGHVGTVVPRALEIAGAKGAHVSAHVIIDQMAIDTARDAERTRADIRERAAKAMSELQAIGSERGGRPGLAYDEGDPAKLLASADAGGSLLVVPREGWFHHGNNDPRPGTSWEPDGLLQLPQSHRGPILYASGKTGSSGKIVMHDCGQPHLAKALDWALLAELWTVREVVIVGCKDDDRARAFQDIADRHGVTVSHARFSTSQDSVLPRSLADADGIILGQAPLPLRTRWYGHPWYDRLIPGFGGDILLVCE